MSQTARDRDFSTPQEAYASGEGPMYSFPFESIGDFSTFIVTRQFKQTRAAYLVDKLSNRYRVGEAIDPAGSSAVLLNTREIGITATGLQSFSRSYAPVPPTETDSRQSVMVNLPTISPASYTYSQFYSSATGLIASSANFRFAEAYAIDGRAAVYFDVYPYTPCVGAGVNTTGGAFDFTYKASTATFNDNDSNATIAAAINALASIIADGITVSVSNSLRAGGPPGGITFTATVGTWLAAPAVNPASLTPASAKFIDVATSSSTVYVFALRTALTMTAHGITNTGQNFAVLDTGNAATFYLLSSTQWGVADANTITINTLNGALPSGTAPDHAGAFVRRYVPGSKPCPCDKVTRFSLSTLTPDTYQGDTYNFLNLLFANATSINYLVGDSTPWPDAASPIKSITSTKISAANL